MIIPVTIEDGILKTPRGVVLPGGIIHAQLVVEEDFHSNDDIDTVAFQNAILKNPAFDFLRDEEEDIYSDADILPENRNPRFHEHLKK